jgi:SAM-dependent methyltransferase
MPSDGRRAKRSDRFGPHLVRRYYEQHTRTFMAFGEGGTLGAMHRAVAAPGVDSKDARFRYVEDRIIGIARKLPRSAAPLRFVDLGCGVGGSLCYIAGQLPMVGTGVTLSPTQARLARERIARAGLSERLTIIAGDYNELSSSVDDPEQRAGAAADVAFAIESFVHAPDARRFFDECHRLLRPGGVLVICDDFRRGATGARAVAAIERFRRGWHVNTLLEPSDVHTLAKAAGFQHETTDDLTPYLDLGRPRDRVVDLVAGPIERLPWRWPRLDPWLGGSALQRCLRHGWLGYDFVVLRRTS